MENYYGMLKRLLLMVAAIAIANLSYAQQRTVTGQVTDAGDGNPIPGVNVIVKGTTNGTITDFDGKFSIQAADADVLVFSYIGYVAQELAISSNNNLLVSLEASDVGLDEVVIIGYGTQKKREIVGSISSVSSKDITTIAAPSFESALQGQAAGLQVITGSGMAGSGSVIRVRGISSVSANGDPLYVVDGIPITSDIFIADRGGGMNGNPLNTINPNDIESVQILKDAAAVGIYGSRGANGVILIETKKGKSGKPQFSFNSQVGVSTYTKKPAMMNAAEWLTMRQEAWENDGNTGVPTQLPGNISWADAWAYANSTGGTGTDWWDEVTRLGINHNYDFSVKMGGEKYRAFGSASYSHDESYLIRNNFDRASVRVNLEYDLLSNLTIGVNSNLSYGSNFQAGTPWEGGLGVAMSTSLPYFPVKNDDGTYFTNGGINNNPVLVSEFRRIRSQELRSITTASISYDPIPNLNIKATGGYDYMEYQYEKYEPAEVTNNDYDISYYSPSYVRNMNYNIVATYSWLLNDSHNFTFMAGHEYQYSQTEKYKYNFDQDDNLEKPIYEDKNPWNDIDPEYEAIQKWSFMSVFGRVNYMYKEKYIGQFTARTDGSSRFGSNNRFGFFPTVALGWIISEENFMDNLGFISHMKLKASYGVTGNSAIDNYARWGTMVEAQATNTYNGVPISYPTRLPNPDVQWETVKTYDIGLELNLFNDRIVFETAYYNKDASDIFVLNAGLSPSVGIGNFTSNVLSVKNTGYEFSLTTRNIVTQTDGFSWTTSFNIAKNENEVTSIGNALPDDIGGGTNDTRIYVGYPVGTNYLVRFWKVDPDDGRPIYLDKDGNATKTFDLENRVPTGSVVPDWVGGITNNLSYKGFDLSFLFTFSIGGNIYDSSAKRQMGIMSDWNFRKDRFDRWTKPGDEATYPRNTLEPETYGSNDIWMNSTRFLHDASYMRLKNLTLGYNFKKEWMEKIKIQSARIYVSGTNLLTFTKFPGVDPEIARDFDNNNDRNMSPNISWLTPPQARTFNFGVSVNF